MKYIRILYKVTFFNQKRNKVLIHATTWMNFEIITLSEKRPNAKDNVLAVAKTIKFLKANVSINFHD